MNKITIALCLAITLIGCGNLKEEVWIYPGQRAQLAYSMELGKDMADPFAEAVGAMLFQTKPDAKVKPKYTGSFSLMGAPVNNQGITVDTTVYFRDMGEYTYDSLLLYIVQTDSLHRLNSTQHEELAGKMYELLSNASFHVSNNTPKHFLSFSFRTDTVALKDLYTIGRYYKTLLLNPGDTLHSPEDFMFSTEKGKFLQGKMSFWKDMLSFGAATGQGQQMNFLETLLQSLKPQQYLTVVHLPGQIKSVSHPLSVISEDGCSVTTTLSAQDLEGGVTFENVIKYKNK